MTVTGGNVLIDLSAVDIEPRSLRCGARRKKPRAGEIRDGRLG